MLNSGAGWWWLRLGSLALVWITLSASNLTRKLILGPAVFFIAPAATFGSNNGFVHQTSLTPGLIVASVLLQCLVATPPRLTTAWRSPLSIALAPLSLAVLVTFGIRSDALHMPSRLGAPVGANTTEVDLGRLGHVQVTAGTALYVDALQQLARSVRPSAHACFVDLTGDSPASALRWTPSQQRLLGSAAIPVQRRQRRTCSGALAAWTGRFCSWSQSTDHSPSPGPRPSTAFRSRRSAEFASSAVSRRLTCCRSRPGHRYHPGRTRTVRGLATRRRGRSTAPSQATPAPSRCHRATFGVPGAGGHRPPLGFGGDTEQHASEGNHFTQRRLDARADVHHRRIVDSRATLDTPIDRATHVPDMHEVACDRRRYQRRRQTTLCGPPGDDRHQTTGVLVRTIDGVEPK